KCEERNANDGVTLRMYAQGQFASNTAYFYTRDHLGSVREMFKSDGTLVARNDYDPWGRFTAVLNTTKPEFNYTGLYRHAKSGLLFATYRAYDPDLGRWLSRDPIGERGGINLYGYVANNPANAIDPLGLDAVVVFGFTPGNPLGHVAVAVSGRGTYSFGTAHDDGTSLGDYLTQQSVSGGKDQLLYYIPTTPEEDQQLVDSFNRARDRGFSSEQANTCSTAVSEGLRDIGVFRHRTPFPKMLLDWFRAGLARRPGVSGMYIPPGTVVQESGPFQKP
ncbi:MAG: hypothetical protein DLM52_00460, partial [Chthoniobacterales bacterium]